MSTIRVPQVVPSPDKDCEAINNACKSMSFFLLFNQFNASINCCLILGLGTDEKALIRILGCRNAAQRRLIRDAYHRIYNSSLIDCLNDELSGDFRVGTFTSSSNFISFLSIDDAPTPIFVDLHVIFFFSDLCVYFLFLCENGRKRWFCGRTIPGKETRGLRTMRWSREGKT